MRTKKPYSLPADVAAKFKMLKGHQAGEYHFNGHRINLVTITLQQAYELVNNRFPYIVAKDLKQIRSSKIL